MFAVAQIVTLVVTGLGLVGSTVAAPVQDATTRELVARGPYDTHNGWVRTYLSWVLGFTLTFP